MGRFLWNSILLAIIIAAVFLMQSFFPTITNELMLSSSKIAERPWAIVTSIFLHASLQHLAYNMVSLILFGLVVENIVKTKKFLLIFLLSGIAANFAALFFYENSLGASGAVFGLIGFLAAIRPKLMVPAFGIPLPVIAAAFLWIIISFAAFTSISETAHAAHLGGLFFGLVFGIFSRKKYAENRKKEKLLSDEEIDEWEEKYMKKN